MKLSACWIAKNEEKNLPRSMESVRNAVDEMIVVDTGSTDDTMKIARELGAKVSSFEWVDDFSAARNRAMELSEGEIVIFLDCDEWFEPALTKKDRVELLKIFAATPELAALQLILYNVNDLGEVFDYVTLNRILRKGPGRAFRQRVHEQFTGEEGKPFVSRWTDIWKIKHSGYAPSIGKRKIERNIPLLEQNARDGNKIEAFLANSYLVREYSSMGDMPKTLEHLRIVLDQPDMIEHFCKKMKDGFLVLLKRMLDVSVHNQNGISADEIERRIVGSIEKFFPQNPMALTSRPYWNYWLEEDDERLLSEIDDVIAGVDRLSADRKASKYSTNNSLMSQLLFWAAYSAEFRGMKERAARYAEACLRVGDMKTSVLHILLRCLRGTPLEAVKERLQGIYPEMNYAQLFFLAKNAGIDGYQGLTYDYLAILMAQGAEDEEIRFADAVLSGRQDETVAMIEAAKQRGVPSNQSPLVVLFGWAAGKGLRDELAETFLLISGKYAELVERFPATADGGSAHVMARVRSLIMLNRDREAMIELLPELSKISVSKAWLRCLAVLAERMSGELGDVARAVYEMNLRYARRVRGWGGLVRTEYAVDRYDKKALRGLASLTEAELEAGVAADKREIANEELLDLAEKAGEIYETKKMPGMALECWRFAFAHGRDNAETHMGRMIAALSKKGG